MPPLNPLPADVKNYQVVLVPAFEEKNKQLTTTYQQEVKIAKAEYDSAMRIYPGEVKAADEKYDREMEEYKKKSFGKKVLEKKVLNENNKPVKVIPSKPVLRSVSPPVMQTTYDLPVLASTYIKPEGLENNPVNALKIMITLYGYDYTQPRTMNDSKNVVSVGKNGTSSGERTYYYTEFSYRHPMSVKLLLPDGKEILNITPQPLNVYKVSTTSQTTQTQSINSELLIKSTEQKILQENLAYINKLLNEKFGFSRVKRTATLYFIKDKDGAYTDLTTAFNEASSGLKNLSEDKAVAVPLLNHAIDVWTKALKESDMHDKKARINEEVTVAVCFNLLETFYALKKYDEGRAVMQTLNTIGLSNKQRMIKNQYDSDYIELKKRL